MLVVQRTVADMNWFNSDNYSMAKENEKQLFSNFSAFPTRLELSSLSREAYSHPTQLRKHLEDWDIIAHAFDTKSNYHATSYYNQVEYHLVIANRGTDDYKSARDDFFSIFLKDTPRFFHTMRERIKSAYIFANYIITNFRYKVLSVTITGHSLGGWLAQIITFYLKYPEYAKRDKLLDYPTHVEKLDKPSKNALRDNINLVPQESVFEMLESKKIEKVGLKIECYSRTWYSLHNLDYLNFHLHTIVFESPGVKPELVRIVENSKIPRNGMYKIVGKIPRKTESMLKRLDITMYMLAPNPINSICEHVGVVMYIDDTPLKDFLANLKDKYLTLGHSIKRIEKFFETDEHEECIYEVLRGPNKPIDSLEDFLKRCSQIFKSLILKPKPLKPDEVRTEFDGFKYLKWIRTKENMNIFNEDEKKLVIALNEYNRLNGSGGFHVRLGKKFPIFATKNGRTVFRNMGIAEGYLVTDLEETMSKFVICIKCLVKIYDCMIINYFNVRNSGEKSWDD